VLIAPACATTWEFEGEQSPGRRARVPRKPWRRTASYFWSEKRWRARGLLAIVVSALQDKNVDASWAELRYFVILALIFIVVAAYRLWFRSSDPPNHCRQERRAG
jgi:hypothetical protein